MTFHPRLLALAASLLLVPASPCAAPAAPSRAVTIRFGGTVEEPGGRPVRGAKVRLEGLAGAAGVTDPEGRYAFSCVVPVDETLPAAPLRLALRASHKGWNLALPSGESTLGLELLAVRAGSGGARLEIRSNDAVLAATVAALARRTAGGTMEWDADFVRQVGAEDRTEPVLAALEIVPWPAPAAVAAPAPPSDTVRAAPARADSAPPAPVAASRPARPASMRLFPSAPEPGAPRPPEPAAPGPATIVAGPGLDAGRHPRGTGGPRAVPDSDTTVVPGIRISVRPDTTAPAPGAPGSGGGGALRVALGRALPDRQPPPLSGRPCECQVQGTVEVGSDIRLRDALRVAVSLANAPAPRDTVVLDMGSPRPFDLGRVPCGRHRLDVVPLSTRRFTVAPPVLAVFDCRAGATQQFRVVLVAR